MNYRLLLSEMLIDYTETRSLEENTDKRKVYTKVIKDLIFILDIEPNEINTINQVNQIISN